MRVARVSSLEVFCAYRDASISRGAGRSARPTGGAGVSAERAANSRKRGCKQGCVPGRGRKNVHRGGSPDGSAKRGARRSTDHKLEPEKNASNSYCLRKYFTHGGG